MGARCFTRIKVATHATVSFGGQTIQGVTENVSLQGFYMRSSKSIPLHQPLRVTLFDQQPQIINANARVVRLDDGGGIGVQISSIDVNSFVALRNYIYRQCDDFNGIMSETYRMIDSIC